MNRRKINLLTTSVVILIIAFVYNYKNRPQSTQVFTKNIEVSNTEKKDGSVFTNKDSYQQDLLNTIAEQNVKTFEKISDSFKKSSTDTLSDTIAKDVFSAYLKYNTSGEIDSSAIKQAVIDNVKNKTPDIQLTTINSLVIVPSSITNLKDYTLKISTVQNILRNQVALASKKPDQATQIKNIYIVGAKLFLKISVPSDLTEYHLELINGYENYAEGFRLLLLQSSDPAKALLGLQVAQKGNAQVLDSVQNIKRIINLNQIDYNKSDRIYEWLLDVPEDQKIKTR